MKAFVGDNAIVKEKVGRAFSWPFLFVLIKDASFHKGGII
jgi:hypothetical protein